MPFATPAECRGATGARSRGRMVDTEKGGDFVDAPRLSTGLKIHQWAGAGPM